MLQQWQERVNEGNQQDPLQKVWEMFTNAGNDSPRSAVSKMSRVTGIQGLKGLNGQ